MEGYDPAGYSYQPVPPQMADPAEEQSVPQRIDHLADSISRNKREKTAASKDAGKKGIKKKILIAGGAITAIIAIVLLIIFHAKGGMARVQLSRTWYAMDEDGNYGMKLNFQYFGDGYVEIVERGKDHEVISSKQILFKYKMNSKKVIEMFFEYGAFAEKEKMVLVQNGKAKDTNNVWHLLNGRVQNVEDRNDWYMDGGILYLGGMKFYPSMERLEKENKAHDKDALAALANEAENEIENIIKEGIYDDYELIGTEQNGVYVLYTYQVTRKPEVRTITNEITLEGCTYTGRVRFKDIRSLAQKWNLAETCWQCKMIGITYILLINRCEGDTIYVEYATIENGEWNIREERAVEIEEIDYTHYARIDKDFTIYISADGIQLDSFNKFEKLDYEPER